MKTYTTIYKNIASTGENSLNVRNFFRIFAASLAGMHAWAAITAQSMNADGISYLDIGDAYFRGDWANAINPVWPPLYSWMLGLVNFIFKPGMAWEFPTVHIFNFLIFLGTLASFEYLWEKLWKYSSSQTQTTQLALPHWAWWSIGYSLFIWTSLNLIQIWAVTPDMLMAALLYLAAGQLIEIRNDPSRWRPFIFLGVLLGLGYLAKTFMFSMALVFLGLCLVLVPRTWRSIAKVSLASALFLLISLPFILLISEKKGALTIGEAGSVTYIRYVHGIPFPHWQGDADNQILLTHPSRIIHRSPPIYAFGEPIGGTYPIATDPSYWYEGIRLPFNFGNQLARTFIGGLFYADLFLVQQGILFASVAALLMMGVKQKLSLFAVLRKWTLVIPAVVAFGLYGLVLVSGRYIGAFVLLFWADILANIRLPGSENNRSWIKVLSAIAVLGLLANIVMYNFEGINRLNPSIQANVGENITMKSAGPIEVAQALQQLGVNQGDKVAIIGYGFDSFWARLARVKIVAEMLETQATEFWIGEETIQQSVLQAFASTGAVAVVAEYVPPYARMDGWYQVLDSNYFIYRFEE